MGRRGRNRDFEPAEAIAKLILGLLLLIALSIWWSRWFLEDFHGACWRAVRFGDYRCGYRDNRFDRFQVDSDLARAERSPSSVDLANPPTC
jgi:hypothetical protein